MDAIIVSLKNRPAETVVAQQKVDVRGRIVYSNGEPYGNGLVELRSNPRYTTTDDDGYFWFEDVPVGNHTISAIENNTVLASVTVRVQRVSQEKDIDVIRLESGDYLVQVSLRVIEIRISLRIDGEQIHFTGAVVVGREGDPPDLGELPDITEPTGSTEVPGQGESPGTEVPPDTPSGPGTPTGSGTSTGPDTPAGPDTSPETGTGPALAVSDQYERWLEWTVGTSVDIFAPRPGNTGVTTIDGQAVIAPGAAGQYVFKIENPDSKAVEYTIRLTESDQNNPKLPMRYRLGTGTPGPDYRVDSTWREASAISSGNVTIEPGGTDYFTLEWKWVTTDDRTDTAIGMQGLGPVYMLNITISAWYK